MTIRYSDALLIQSIFHTEKDNQGSRLPDMIAYADYVNHTIMTFDEFQQGLRKLIALGLLEENGGNLATTDKFEDWWNQQFAKKKRIQIHDELDQIKSYLEQSTQDIDETGIEIQTTKSDFDQAVTDYKIR